MSRRPGAWLALAALVLSGAAGPALVEALVPGAGRTDVTAVLEPPSAGHWLGTDELGRDAAHRTLMGLRISLLVALAGTLASSVVGVSLGLWAGLGGRWADGFVQRTSEVMISLPKLPLFLLWASVDVRRLGLEPSLAVQVGQLTLAFMWLSWVTMARVVRASALSVRAAPFVEAARALGLPPATVAWRHVLPHLGRPVRVTMALDFGDILLTETALSFLGLGIAPPTPSLGSLLSRGIEYALVAPHLLWAPGLLTMALVLIAHRLADGVVAEPDRLR